MGEIFLWVRFFSEVILLMGNAILFPLINTLKKRYNLIVV